MKDIRRVLCNSDAYTAAFLKEGNLAKLVSFWLITDTDYSQVVWC